MKMSLSLSVARITGVSLIASSIAVTGCSLFSEHRSAPWMKDGALALSRAVPAAAEVAPATDPVLGFMPSQPSSQGHVVRITRTDKKVTVYDGGRTLLSLSGDGIQGLKPGRYSVALKQRTPLWYAPDQYFADRLLDIPGDGNGQRYRRGALGPYALFLNDQTPIHSGPTWREEIGGVRIDEREMAQLFEALEVGTVVEVR